MTVTLDTLQQFRKHPAAGNDYPEQVLRLWAPDDDVHGALCFIVENTRTSLGAAMYGWDDDEIQQLFEKAWLQENLPVTICLDSSQKGGVHESVLVAQMEKLLPPGTVGSQLVWGRSRLHAISHDKIIRSDDISIGGSTNLSGSGETKQNNELVVVKSAAYALETEARIQMIRAQMAAQMAAAGVVR